MQVQLYVLYIVLHVALASRDLRVQYVHTIIVVYTLHVLDLVRTVLPVLCNSSIVGTDYCSYKIYCTVRYVYSRNS